MKYKYKFHPGQCELGENEKFYGDMEARGWRLVKRGAYLSKFEPAEPSGARYRIEVFSPGLLDQPALPEEQLAVFEDCGWEHVADQGVLHIFRAPAGSGAPEFYADPAQQAETLKKLKRNAVWGWVPSLALWAVYLLVYPVFNSGTRLGAEFQRRLVELPPLFLLAGFLLLEELYSNLRNAVLITRTCRRMRRGVPLDHSPGKGRGVHRAVKGTLWTLVGLAAALLAVQLLATRSTDLPAAAEDPYLLLSDLGWEGERTCFMGRDSGVTYSPSLLADYWDVNEYQSQGDEGPGPWPWLYQDVYRLRFPGMAQWLARALMNTASFSGGAGFVPVEVPGLDAAWAGGSLELVAVKGDLAAYIICLPGGSAAFGPEVLAAALAEKWGNTLPQQ